MLQYTPKFFSETEFAQAVPACALSDLKPDLLERLDYARQLYGKPIYINSAYRSVEYELKMHRSGFSSHTKGLAVDIRCTGSLMRLQLVKALLRAGFRRIGLANTYIHVDLDPSKPKCMWLYNCESDISDEHIL